jgi:hypothetical protein
MRRYGFLLDRDVSKTASLFPRGMARTVMQLELPADAPDASIVKKACEHDLTIVTGNGEDFIREIQKFQGQTQKKDCHEMSGLIILPNGYETQGRLLKTAEERLRFGGRKITWTDVCQKTIA